MRSIIMCTESIQAILEDRKTMTRRVMNPQPIEDDLYAGGWKYGKGPRFVSLEWLNEEHDLYDCPYGKPGDNLWVREAWDCLQTGNGKTVPLHTEYLYKADDTSGNPDDKWFTPIYMPKVACRLWLRVKAVRVEQVQEITGADIIAEGIKVHVPVPGDGTANPRQQFRNLWNIINVKRGYGWAVNPWVWVIEFERIAKPEGWPEVAA